MDGISRIILHISFSPQLTYGAKLSTPVWLFLVLIQPIGRGTTQASTVVSKTACGKGFDDQYLERVTRQPMISLAWLVEHHLWMK